MELDFDKEIDALLRKARGSGSVLAGGRPPHLEADEIIAFAENALPEKTRMFFTEHLAECDRCRKILTNTISFGAEAAPEAAVASAPAVAASTEPWYRKLFLFPNLAYAMAGLVLVFSAFLGYTVLRNSNGDLASPVSQVAKTENEPDDPRVGEDQFPARSANTAANSAGIEVNTPDNALATPANKSVGATTSLRNSNASPRPTDERADLAEKTAPSGVEKEMVLDGVSSGSLAEAPAAQPPAPKPAKEDDGDDRKKKQESVSNDKQKDVMDSNTINSRTIDQLPALTRGGPSKKGSGPSRDMQTQFPNRAQNSYEVAVTRNVSGKKFERRNGVWYDSAYSGQATTNVRRGTDAYKKLDAIVRSSAENLGGTVVIVSGGAAYRIQ